MRPELMRLLQLHLRFQVGRVHKFIEHNNESIYLDFPKLNESHYIPQYVLNQFIVYSI